MLGPFRLEYAGHWMWQELDSTPRSKGRFAFSRRGGSDLQRSTKPLKIPFKCLLHVWVFTGVSNPECIFFSVGLESLPHDIKMPSLQADIETHET